MNCTKTIYLFIIYYINITNRNVLIRQYVKCMQPPQNFDSQLALQVENKIYSASQGNKVILCHYSIYILDKTKKKSCLDDVH